MKLILLFFLIVSCVTDAATPCENVPRCWQDEITCTLTKKCNGDLCQNACSNGSVSFPPDVLRALKLQRKIQTDLSLEYSELIGTHNSFISHAYGIGLEEEDSRRILSEAKINPSRVIIANQRLSVTEQLQLGVRHIEIDVHWLPVVTNGLAVCHWDITPPPFPAVLNIAYSRTTGNSSKSLNWAPKNLGCNRQSFQLRNALLEIVQFLNAHPDEFLVLYFDNRIPYLKFQQTLDLIREVFGNSLFTPLMLERQFQGCWPNQKSLLQYGFKVMIENFDKFKWHRKSFLVNETLFNRDDVWKEFDLSSFKTYPECTVNGIPTMDLSAPKKWTRFRALDGSLSLGPFTVFSSYQNTISGDNVKEMIKCGISIISLDQITPSLARNAIWTWEEGEPRLNDGCAALNLQSGRWVTQPCNKIFPRLCGKVTNVENIITEFAVGSTGPFSRSKNTLESDQKVLGVARKTCPAGYKFHLPRTSLENQIALRQIKMLGIRGLIWINLNYDYAL